MLRPDRFFSRLRFPLALTSALAAVPAAAQDNVDAADIDMVVNVARGFGSAVAQTDSVGDPMIRGRMEGIGYLILFFGCKDNANCTAIQFVSSWDQDGVDPERISQWNRDKLFGTAYLDADQDPALKMPVNLKSGVTYANLEDTFDWWRTIVAMFKSEVVEGGSAAAGASEAPSADGTASSDDDADAGSASEADEADEGATAPVQ